MASCFSHVYERSVNYQYIRDSLEKLHAVHQQDVLSDPIQFPLQFTQTKDQEIVAWISALYAFGNVKMIFNTLRNILGFLEQKPYQTLTQLNEKNLTQYPFVTHRWIKPDDTRSMIRLISSILQKDQSLEKSFMKFYSVTDETLERSMREWMKHLQEALILTQGKPLTRGQKFLLSAPGKSSTSKRLVMFFRWVVRQEQPDLGIWKNISVSQLLIPLDAHLFRFSHYLGFIKKNQTGWKAVTEATRHFREISPEDPVKYDFALARLGILNLCAHKITNLCSTCHIQNHCRLYRQKLKSKL